MLKTIKKLSRFRPLILSRHPSHDRLRVQHKLLPLFPFRSVIRLGSSTIPEDNADRIELNSVEAIKNSANKLLMKQCFTEAEVKTADWWIYVNGTNNVYSTKGSLDSSLALTIENLPYPIVAKHIFGSRGNGNYKLNNQEQLEAWLVGKDLKNYIFEKFYNYNREYRLHVSENGCFYTCRKMLKSDTPDDKRWFKNDSNSVWIIEGNEQFDKPSNWDTVVEESIKALKAVGLDFGAVDLRIQSRYDGKDRLRENPDFIVVEINSAPSFGEVTLEKYLEELPKLLKSKYERTK